MRSSLISTVLLAAMFLPAAFAVIKKIHDGPGLTHEEYLESLTLNTTEGWEPMARVPQYLLDEGDFLDLGNISGIEKRGGGRQFIGYVNNECSGSYTIDVVNFGCGVCASSATSLKGGFLWRQTISGDYPTGAWFGGLWCSGPQMHSQGINPNQYSSCDTAQQWTGGSPYLSVILYQGC
ncbi:hypothetical protein MFRU_043g00380 [Monilinia fructicola]|nr:hypothetical protein MFRU_043g00380 [Monilinia fructicola]